MVSVQGGGRQGGTNLETCRGPAYGRPEVVNDADWLRRHVTELTARQERDQQQPWAPSDAPACFIEAMLHGIVGFRFAITRLEGKWKMSQNRTPHDREGVVKGLALRDCGDDREVAELVARQTPPSDADSWRKFCRA